MRKEIQRFLAFIKLLASHPIGKRQPIETLFRFCRLHLQLMRQVGYRKHPFTDSTYLLLQNGMTNALMNLYCGLLEFEDMAFMLHFLRREDLMLDVGANVGCYAVLAGGHVGARVLAIEPVPATCQHLTANVIANDISDKVKIFNCAVGAELGTIAFTATFDTVNRVATSEDSNTIEVPVNTLDHLLTAHPTPTLVKIDVEGFEWQVLQGAESLLQQPDLKVIIIELNGSGTRYQVADRAIHERLVDAGFQPYSYQPFTRMLTLLDKPGKHNTLYIREIDFVQTRVKTAERVVIRKLAF